nr:NADH-quinone oxidoreductase subunit H [Thermogutta sp.]
FFFMWMRWSWPRFRFDQLMTLAWKPLISWGIVQVTILVVWYAWWEPLVVSQGWSSLPVLALINWVTFILTWVITAAIAQPHYDNSPRRDLVRLAQGVPEGSPYLESPTVRPCDA